MTLRYGFVCAVLMLNGCSVDVPEVDDGTVFRCNDNDQCAKDHFCWSPGTEPRVCVPDAICLSDGDCPDGWTCLLSQESRCFPGSGGGQGCQDHGQCGGATPYCDAGTCVNPCDSDPCKVINDDERCIVDMGAAPGYRCVGCRDPAFDCADGHTCAASAAYPGARCVPECQTAGAPCNGFPGLCAEVASFDAGGNDVSKLVCVECIPQCQGATPDCVVTNAGAKADTVESATSCQPTGGPCTNDSVCGGNGICVQQSSGAPNLCVERCNVAGDDCNGSSGLNGRCASVNDFNANPINACAECGANCPGGERCVVDPSATYYNETSPKCECVDTGECMAARGDAFQCVNGVCDDSCVGGTPDCNSGYVCTAGVCVVDSGPTCNDGTPVDPPEVCDDGDPGGGPCNFSCTGPECSWGIVIPAGFNYVDIPADNRHNMGGGFTIELLARISTVPNTNVNLIARGDLGSGRKYRIFVTPGGEVVFDVEAAGATVQAMSAPGVFSWNAINHIVAVRQGLDFRLFVGGTPRANSTNSTMPNPIGASGSLTLGMRPGGADLGTELRLDDIRIYNVGMSDAEVGAMTDYCLGNSNHSALIGEWLSDFGDSTGVAPQVRDTGNTTPASGTLIGNATFGDVFR